MLRDGRLLANTNALDAEQGGDGMVSSLSVVAITRGLVPNLGKLQNLCGLYPLLTFPDTPVKKNHQRHAYEDLAHDIRAHEMERLVILRHNLCWARILSSLRHLEDHPPQGHLLAYWYWSGRIHHVPWKNLGLQTSSTHRRLPWTCILIARI